MKTAQEILADSKEHIEYLRKTPLATLPHVVYLVSYSEKATEALEIALNILSRRSEGWAKDLHDEIEKTIKGEK